MPRSGSLQRSLSQEFHDIMLGVTSGTVNRGPSASQGPSSSQRGPTTQSASPPQRAPPNTSSRPTAQPLRPTFRSSEKGASAELKEVGPQLVSLIYPLNDPLRSMPYFNVGMLPSRPSINAATKISRDSEKSYAFKAKNTPDIPTS